MRKNLMLVACVGFVVSVVCAAFVAFAASDPVSEAAWLAGQLGKDVEYLGKEDNLSGKSWTGSVPDGATHAIVKGGTVMKYVTPIVLPLTSEGLLNNGGQQPDISHITFFKVVVDTPFVCENATWKKHTAVLSPDGDDPTEVSHTAVPGNNAWQSYYVSVSYDSIVKGADFDMVAGATMIKVGKVSFHLLSDGTVGAHVMFGKVDGHQCDTDPAIPMKWIVSSDPKDVTFSNNADKNYAYASYDFNNDDVDMEKLVVGKPFRAAPVLVPGKTVYIRAHVDVSVATCADCR